MKFSLNILFVFIIVVLATLAVPIPKNEVSGTTDLAKREGPSMYQDVMLRLLVFRAVNIMLRFVWDCGQARFIARTAGAGSTWTEPRATNGPGQLEYTLTIHPNGVGSFNPNTPDNPSSSRSMWDFDQQTVWVDFQTFLDNNNNVVLQSGDWSYYGRIGALTATKMNSHQTAPVQFVSVEAAPPIYGDPANPPSAAGSGFNTGADNSVYILPLPSSSPQPSSI